MTTKQMELMERTRMLATDAQAFGSQCGDAAAGAAMLLQVAADMLRDDATGRGAEALQAAMHGKSAQKVAEAAGVPLPVFTEIVQGRRAARLGEAAELAATVGAPELASAWLPRVAGGPLVGRMLKALLKVLDMDDATTGKAVIYHLACAATECDYYD